MPGGVGARQMPQLDESFPTQRQQIRPGPAATPTGLTALIARLDAITPVVQAFDCVLMLIAGVVCLRARKSPGFLLLAIACLISAVILLGFFLSATYQSQSLFALNPQLRLAAYAVARLLAPFELLLFAAAIIILARRSG